MSYRFSEEIRIQSQSAVTELAYRSLCEISNRPYFEERVLCLPKLVPSRFTSTVVKRVDPFKGLHYKDKVVLLPRLKPVKFSETVCSFPRESHMAYATTLTHTHRLCSRWYTTRVFRSPIVKLWEQAQAKRKWQEVSLAFCQAHRMPVLIESDVVVPDTSSSSSGDHDVSDLTSVTSTSSRDENPPLFVMTSEGVFV